MILSFDNPATPTPEIRAVAPHDLTSGAPEAEICEPLSRLVCFRIAAAAVIVGAVCRLAQYLSRQSFWGDEAYVVLNVRAKAARELMGRLTMTVAGHPVPPQTAPPFYLLSLKGLAKLWGENEFAYRMPAVAMGIVALPLFAALAWRMLPPTAATVATVWVSVSDKLIDHSVLVKQYGGDVAVAVLLTLLAIGRPRQSALRRLAFSAVVAAAALWLSAPVVFIFGGIALALLPEVLRIERGARGWLAWAACCAPVAVSLCFLYGVSLRNQQDPELYKFWAEFFPDYARPMRWPWWALRQVYGLCNHPFKPYGAFVLALGVLGAAGFWKREKRQWAAVLVLPVLLTMLASALHQYPFGGTRVTLFLVPGVLLLAAAGVVETGRLLPRDARRWAWLAAVPMILSGAWQAGYHLFVPRCTSHLRPAVEFVQGRYLAGDTILVTGNNTWPVFFVYWPGPPGRVQIVPDGVKVSPPGRFWCVCEYAPGEFEKKRKPTIDLASAGAVAIDSGRYKGRGGAAFLFERPSAAAARFSTDPSQRK